MAVGTTGRFPSSQQVRQRMALPQFGSNMEATRGVGSLTDLIKNKGGAIAGLAGSMIPQKGFGNVAGGALKGAGTGASLGATIGSVVPVIGTAIGGAAGAIIGGVAGAAKGGSDWKQQQHQEQMEALKGIRGRMNG